MEAIAEASVRLDGKLLTGKRRAQAVTAKTFETRLCIDGACGVKRETVHLGAKGLV